jgi:hypothetical protein
VPKIRAQLKRNFALNTENYATIGVRDSGEKKGMKYLPCAV